MTRQRQAVGAYGERCAVRHLVANGLRVVDRNWRCPSGEIDIVAWDGRVLAFCEVKTRRGTAFGPPAEAVVPAKARRLRGLAAQWLAQHPTHPDEVRFDVISVFAPARGAARVEHLKAAF
ncbi:YraN family protein [Micromonospora sp. NPDC050397]|uniref:YraN family protein n=1 Tax=Micromonospora sp. NPDC050397 TaxID=3364279 RepID=UPI00384AA3BC